MPNPVQGNQQPPTIPLPGSSEQQEIERAESVSRGHPTTDSSSHRANSDSGSMPDAPREQAPSIPAPVPGATASPEDLKGQYIQHHASQIRLELMGGIETIKVTNPELVTPDILAKQQHIEAMLAKMESAPRDVVDSMHLSARELSSSAMDRTLTADKLDEIIAQLQAKMDDNSVKYQQEKIEISSQAAQQQHDSNIDEIKKGIEEQNKANEIAEQNKAKKSKGLFALKIIASIFFPPLGIVEAVKAIDREVSGVDDGTSMFSSEDAKRDRWIRLNMANDIGISGTPTPTQTESPLPDESQRLDEERQNLEVAQESDPVSDATEGLDLAKNGMTQAEFMKLLQQIKESDEAKEKIEEAIAALEAGDPELAATILDVNADSSDTDSEAGDSGFGDDEDLSADLQPEDFERPESTHESTPEDEGTAEIQEFNDFMDQISQVPEATIDSQASSFREQSLIQRGNFA